MDASEIEGLIAQFLKKKIKVSEKPIISLTAAEKADWEVINARTESLKKEVLRAAAKIENDRKRWWIDIEDRYDLHGKALQVIDGAIYETVVVDKNAD